MKTGQPESNVKLFNGYGHEYDDLEYLQTEIHNFKDFETAASMINPSWNRYNLHKWVYEGKVCKSDILVLTDDAIFSNVFSGKKMFLHVNEISRIKTEYEQKIQPNYKCCEWCGRRLRTCVRNECSQRYRSNPNNILKDAEISELVAGAIERLERKKRAGISVFRKPNFKSTDTE